MATSRTWGGLLQDVKRASSKGYSYDDAQASFELLALRQQKKLPAYFTVDRFSVTVEKRARSRRPTRFPRPCGGGNDGGRCEDFAIPAAATARSMRWTRRCAWIWGSIRPISPISGWWTIGAHPHQWHRER